MADLVGPIQFKRGTSAAWASATVPLAAGEMGVDLTLKRVKIGDGATLWPALPWITTDAEAVARLEELADQIDTSISMVDSTVAAVLSAGTASRAQVESIVDASVGPSAAEQMQNPESALQGATIDVVQGVLGGGVAGMLRVIDARTNLATSRGTWAGIVMWLINTGSANPTHFLPGDIIQEVETVAIAWNPTQLTGKLLWLDAQALSLAGGAAVSSWADLTGLGQHAVQATTSKQPTYTLNKINGKPAVVADGVDDALVATLTADYPSALTIYAVAGTDLADNTSGADYLWDASDSVPNYDRASLYRGTDEAYNARRGTTVASAAAAWTTGAKIIRVTVNGASSSIRIGDSTTVASGSLATSAIVRAFHLFTKGVPGSTNYWAGYVGEFLVVGGVPTTDDDTKIMTYLKSRWGF